MTEQGHAWESGRAVWHAGYAVLVGLVAVLATAVDDLSTGRRLVVLGLLAAGAASYALLGVRAFSCAGPTGGGRAHIAIATAVAVVGFAVCPVLLAALLRRLRPDLGLAGAIARRWPRRLC